MVKVNVKNFLTGQTADGERNVTTETAVVSRNNVKSFQTDPMEAGERGDGTEWNVFDLDRLSESAERDRSTTNLIGDTGDRYFFPI